MTAGLMEDISNPAGLVLLTLLAGFGFVLLAKIYGLIFMNGKSPHRVGEAMNIDRATVTDWAGGEGYIDAGGELWRAVSTDELAPGDKVAVVAMNGLTLKVRKRQK